MPTPLTSTGTISVAELPSAAAALGVSARVCSTPETSVQRMMMLLAVLRPLPTRVIAVPGLAHATVASPGVPDSAAPLMLARRTL